MNQAHFNPLPKDMSKEEFIALFGGVYEYSPWIAEKAWERGLSDEQSTPAGLSRTMMEIVNHADKEALMKLINAHPDLAGKAAVSGELTVESLSEQSSAGINQCNTEEFIRFQRYNAAYKEKFGFPFIMAVKGSNRHKILAAFEIRLEHDPDTEFSQAIEEINKIARFRLEEIANN